MGPLNISPNIYTIVLRKRERELVVSFIVFLLYVCIFVVIPMTSSPCCYRMVCDCDCDISWPHPMGIWHVPYLGILLLNYIDLNPSVADPDDIQGV